MCQETVGNKETAGVVLARSPISLLNYNLLHRLTAPTLSVSVSNNMKVNAEL